MNMQNCTLCPRNCHADRTRGYGFCRAGEEAEIALVSLHRWEEPCLSGQNGAGTVFFSHCSMQCIFCQNHEISTESKRKVFCSITSVSASEWFEAGRNGLQAELRITMFAFDYHGEKIAEVNGQRYSIYRTFRSKPDEIELYLEKKAGI